jgi:hypothetical protein
LSLRNGSRRRSATVGEVAAPNTLVDPKGVIRKEFNKVDPTRTARKQG